MKRQEQLRVEILRQCYAYRPLSRDADHIAMRARRDGEIADCSAADVTMEAEYLLGLGYLEKVPGGDLEVTAVRWKITSAGIKHAELNGLV